jgi:hypothetical protein
MRLHPTVCMAGVLAAGPAMAQAILPDRVFVFSGGSFSAN